MSNNNTTQKKIAKRLVNQDGRETNGTKEAKETKLVAPKPKARIIAPMPEHMKREREEAKKLENAEDDAIKQQAAKPRINMEMLSINREKMHKKKHGFSSETPSPSKAQPLQKRKKFEETHTRVTTYIENDQLKQLRMIKDRYNIPMTEVIYNALEEYLTK